MIVTQFKGRIGNQLFQYAAARRFAIDGGTELKLDLTNYEKGPGYILNLFNVPQNIATKNELDHFERRRLSRYIDFFRPHYKRMIVFEKNSRFDKTLIGIKRNDMYVRGFFQSEKYFKPIENIIRKEFKLKNIDENKLNPILGDIRRAESVSIHIRRTDFLTEKHKKVYEQVPIEYYRQAVNRIREVHGNIIVFIFSDDIEWVMNNLKFPGLPMNFISGGRFTDMEEFFLMGQCKHNITANSTFSWWAAWLNENKNKIIITPKKWFVESNMGEEDLIPPEWIKL